MVVLVVQRGHNLQLGVVNKRKHTAAASKLLSDSVLDHKHPADIQPVWYKSQHSTAHGTRECQDALRRSVDTRAPMCRGDTRHTYLIVLTSTSGDMKLTVNALGLVLDAVTVRLRTGSGSKAHR